MIFQSSDSSPSRNARPAELPSTRRDALGLRTSTRLAFIATLTGVSAAQAQNYYWVPWSPGSLTSISATDTPGTVTLTCTTGRQVNHNFPIQFDNTTITPPTTVAAAVGVVTASNAWSFTLDFKSVSNTSNLVIGIGNLGYGVSGYPGYKLEMRDNSILKLLMSPALLTPLGSYDHTWLNTGQQFNDDVVLNANGTFSMTTIAGLNNTNSDILLLSLPANVGTITISSIGPSAGDTINVLWGWEACPCFADFDGSGGTPDAADIDAFFAAWLMGDPAADTDCSGGAPDANDIALFFAQWLAGGC